MKSQTVRIASVLLLVAMIFTSVLVGDAQSPREPQEQEKSAIPGLTTQEVQAVGTRVLVPRECARLRPVIQVHDVADNFTSPGTATTPSAALMNFISANNLQMKGYDDPRVNKVIADSFKLGNCKVCYATLEVRVKHYADVWNNDGLVAGVAPFTPTSLRLIATPVWNPGDSNPKTGTYVLPANALSTLVFNNQPLDVYAQDDTNFDYMKLSVWYY